MNSKEFDIFLLSDVCSERDLYKLTPYQMNIIANGQQITYKSLQNK